MTWGGSDGCCRTAALLGLFWSATLCTAVVCSGAVLAATTEDLPPALTASRGHHQATVGGIRAMVMIEPAPVVSGGSYRLRLTFANARTGFPVKFGDVRIVPTGPGEEAGRPLSAQIIEDGGVRMVLAQWVADRSGQWTIQVSGSFFEKGLRTFLFEIPVGSLK